MPALHPIIFVKETFLSLLPQQRLFIPELQRPFAWKEDQINDFVKDVLNLIWLQQNPKNAQVEHFFGTVVLQNTLDLRGIAIIDGQQRVTAVSLTLGLLKAEMNKLKELILGAGGPQVTGLVSRLDGNMPQIDVCLVRPPDVNNNVLNSLLPSPEIQLTFSSLISGGDGQILTENTGPAIMLRRCAEILQTELIAPQNLYEGLGMADKVTHLLAVKHAILDSLLFVAVTTQSADSSYDLFESLNATGEPLNAVDLLKIWIMASTINDPNSLQIAKTMREIATPPNTDEKPTSYLNYFFQARTSGHSPNKNTPKTFVNDVRKYIFRDPSLNEAHLAASNLQLKIYDECQLLEQWRPHYLSLVSTPAESPISGATSYQKDRLNELMKTLKHVTALPLFIVASAKLSLSDFYEFVHLVERLFFRVKIICRERETYLKALYSPWMQQLQDGTFTLANAKREANKLIKDKADDINFEVCLKKELNGEGNRVNLRYFLWLMDIYSANPAPNPLTLDRTMTIEHIQPQNLVNDSVAMTKAGINEPEDIQRLGNLCLLTNEENAALSDNSYSDKRAIVSGWLIKPSPSHLTCALSRSVYEHHSSNNWTSADIAAREQAITQHACRVFSF